MWKGLQLKAKKSIKYLLDDIGLIILPFTNKVYDAYCRKKLKNDNFTIITNSCAGGFIYHRLGKKFLSPTINLFIGDSTDQFVRFVENLDEYLKKDICFLHDIDKGFPRALLGDVKIGFLHYHTEQEAFEKWNQRKKRINFENIFVIVYGGVNKEEYIRLKKIKANGKIKDFVVLGSEYEERICDIVIKGWIQNQSIFKRNRVGRYVFEKSFDFVSFLNQTKDFHKKVDI